MTLNAHCKRPFCPYEYQSDYRKKHSTETAMLWAWCNVLLAADKRQVTLLGLLGLSAASDCVDHELMLQRLPLSFGVTGVVLKWIQSFLTDRTQQIAYCGQLSASQPVLVGVPRDRYWGHYCMYCTLLNWARCLHGTICSYISTPTTSKSIYLWVLHFRGLRDILLL